MLALGFSINLLTLLALVLAIGLVVDDAIIVVENVNRHLEGGMPPLAAAMQAARELGGPDHRHDRGAAGGLRPDRVSGRPHGRAVHRIRLHAGGRGDRFGDDRADALAHDVLAAAQAASCGPRTIGRRASVKYIDARFERLRSWYQHRLERSLHYTPVTAVFVVLVLVSIVLLYRSAKSELAPQEDQGFVLAQSTSAPDATLQRKLLYGGQGLPTSSKLKTGMPRCRSRSRRPAESIMACILAARSAQASGRERDPAQPAAEAQLGRRRRRSRSFSRRPCPAHAAYPVQFAIKTTEPAAASERGLAGLSR